MGEIILAALIETWAAQNNLEVEHVGNCSY